MDEHQRHGPAGRARRRLTRHGRRRQLVGDRRLERAGRRRLRRLPRPPAAPRFERQPDRRAPSTRSPSSCATTARPTTSSCRPPTRPGRPTMAGAATTAQVGANLYGDHERQHQLGPDPGGRRPLAGPRLRGQLQSPLHHRRRHRRTLRARRTICSAPTMRRSTGSRRRATTSPTSRASTPTGSGPTTSRTTSRSSRSAMTNTGRATSARMSRKRAIPA